MQWFYDMRTRGKLALSFAIMVVLLVATGAVGLSMAAESNAALDRTYHREMIGVEVAQHAQTERALIVRAYLRAIVSTGELRAQQMRDFEQHATKTKELLDELDGVTAEDEQRVHLVEAKRLMGEYLVAAREVMTVPLAEIDRLQEKIAAAWAIGSKIGAILDEHIKVKKESAKEMVEASAASYARGRNVAIGLTSIAVLFAVSLALIVGRSIATPLAQAVSVLERVSQGDLVVRLDNPNQDEVGEMARALNASLESVRTTLASVQSVSVEVSAASTDLAANAQEISAGAQEQAASLEQTAASVEEISSTVKLNTETAQNASQLANHARDVAERGGAVVSAAVAAMRDITTSSKKIADIITTIDEIAFQTNLLALNAAVEAARGGEQGRGFGVVAAEVRSLAQRTGSAAKEIRGLIADSSSRVELGTHKVNESGKTLEEIVKSVQRVTDMVTEIAAASKEQNTGLEQVNTAVTQVDQVTQTNAAQTEQLSATATSLSDKSSRLQALVAAFELGAGEPRKPLRTAAPPVSAVHRLARANPTAQRAQKVANGGFEEF